MSWFEIVGWLGAALTFSAYSMRTMLPLRCIAIAANVAFITFSWFAEVWPTLILHSALLPFNTYRLYELLAGLKSAKAARWTEGDFSWLANTAKPTRYKAGEKLFNMGDAPTHLYVIDSGEVRIDEIDVVLGKGDLVGEIAFFTEQKERTASATCITDCSIFPIDEARFMSLYHQSPAFGIAIVKLVTKRLLERKDKLELET